MRKRLTYANVAATLALVLAMSGGALAASQYVINSTKQINPKVIKKLRGKTGATGKTGAPGAAGPPGPASGPAGGDLSGSYPNPVLRDGAVTPSKTSSIPGARVEEGTQTITDGAYVPVSFPTVAFNVGGVFSAGSPTKLTAPIAGVYVVAGSVEWDSGEPGWRQLEIDTAKGGRVASSLTPVAAAQFVYSNVSTVIKLSAGESVQLTASQASGGPLFYGGGSFAMNWVGSGS